MGLGEESCCAGGGCDGVGWFGLCWLAFQRGALFLKMIEGIDCRDTQIVLHINVINRLHIVL